MHADILVSKLHVVTELYLLKTFKQRYMQLSATNFISYLLSQLYFVLQEL